MTTTTEQTPGNDTHRDLVSALPLVNQFDYTPYWRRLWLADCGKNDVIHKTGST